MLIGSVSGWRVIRNSFAIGSLLALTMCSNLTHIDVSAGGKAEIPAATLLDKLLGSVAFGGFDHVDFSQSFKNQGVTKDDVNAVHLKSMTLIVEDPATGNFDFIKSVHFFAKADGLDKVEIATMDSIPMGKRELDLVVNAGTDLKAYVVAPSMQIVSEVQGSLPSEKTTVAAAVVLDADIHIPGCN
ncbi:MAG: hypothetical protein ABJE95_06665 [Byssovorax sp.]